MELIGFIVVIAVLGYVGFYVYLFFARPDVFEQMQKRRHERAMARLAEEEARRKAETGSVLAGIAKAVLAAAVKGRPHH